MTHAFHFSSSALRQRTKPTAVVCETPRDAGYRPDLDGVRAIAVWAVILYHISRTSIPGGYLGVDIFFVLSGFLITSILWREASMGTFSIIKFYDRRVRRIMPALITLLSVTTVVAAVILLPSDLIGYSKSLLASLAFVANIYFWRDTNYFAAAAETKPLLHLWSLGIEEQFYILFPWLVAGLARFWRRGGLLVLATLVLASLVADVVLRSSGGASPAFFLLPTRGWELGLGGILAIIPSQLRVSLRMGEVAASLGALLVLFGLFAPVPAEMNFPPALPATIGTAFIIFAGRQASRPLVNRSLEVRPMVFFGLISYSLYLWHWPIIVLGEYYLVRDFSALETAGALLLMVMCAYTSWRYIERPFRSKAMPIKRVRLCAAAGVLATALVGVFLLRSEGLPGRLQGPALALNEAVGTHYRCPVSEMLLFGASRACVMNLPSRNPDDADVVLLGNSHAQMYAPLVASILAERRLTGVLVPLNSCTPTIRANLDIDCIHLASENLKAVLALRHAKTVIIALTWSHAADSLVGPTGEVLDNRGGRALVAALDDVLDRLRNSGRRVVLIGPIAVPGWNVASILSRDIAFGRPVTQRLFKPSAEFYDEYGNTIRHFSEDRNLKFARPDVIQCADGKCAFVIDNHALFADQSHLAARELYRFRKQFEAVLSNGLASRSDSLEAKVQ